MKKIYSFFLAIFLLSSVSSAFGQVPLLIDSLRVNVAVKSTDLDITGETHVKSTATVLTEWTWVREIVGLPAEWQTQVCDPNLCWSHSVSSGTFTLDAGQSFPLIVHFKPKNVAGSGIAYITFTQVGTSNSVKVEFNVNDFTSNTEAPTDFSKLELYPNPVRDHFTLVGVPSDIKMLTLSNLEGRRLCHFEMSPDGRFDIPGGYESGTYLLSLEDEKSRPLKTIPMQKL